MQLKGLMPKQWSNTAIQFSVAPLIFHGLIPDGERFLPRLPPSLLGRGEQVLGSIPLSHLPTALLSEQTAWHLDPACSSLHPQQHQSWWQYRCGPTFTSVSHCPVTITTEHKGTLKTPISGLPNHTATEPNLTHHCSKLEYDFLPPCDTLFCCPLWQFSCVRRKQWSVALSN